MIYLLTSGRYSDYEVEGLVENDAKISALQFKEVWNEFIARRDAISEAYGVAVVERFPQGISRAENAAYNVFYNTWYEEHPVTSLAEIFVQLFGGRVLNYEELYV